MFYLAKDISQIWKSEIKYLKSSFDSRYLKMKIYKKVKFRNILTIKNHKKLK